MLAGWAKEHGLMSVPASLVRFNTLEEFKEVEMAEQSQVDFFTVSDRRELIKQGLQLDEVIRQMNDAKITALATVAMHDHRIGSLETSRTQFQASVKAYIATATL